LLLLLTKEYKTDYTRLRDSLSTYSYCECSKSYSALENRITGTHESFTPSITLHSQTCRHVAKNTNVVHKLFRNNVVFSQCSTMLADYNSPVYNKHALHIAEMRSTLPLICYHRAVIFQFVFYLRNVNCETWLGRGSLYGGLVYCVA